MCGNNPQLDAALITMCLNFLSEILVTGLSTNNTTDVLMTATTAYQQGKITKTQYIAVINALDERPVNPSPWVDRPNSYLNQYRR